MRSVLLLATISTLILVFSLHTSQAGDEKKTIKPVQQWSGKTADNNLIKLAPKAGYLKSQKALDALWTGWNLKKEMLPKVDFDNQIVFVQLSPGGPNVPRPTYTLDAKGNLTVRSIATRIGGPGFGYSIDVLNRDGIKTYQGNAIK